MLKGRWRIALKKVEQKTSTLTKTVIAACVLHNICIERGVTYMTPTTAIQMIVLKTTTMKELVLKLATTFEKR